MNTYQVEASNGETYEIKSDGFYTEAGSGNVTFYETEGKKEIGVAAFTKPVYVRKVGNSKE